VTPPRATRTSRPEPRYDAGGLMLLALVLGIIGGAPSTDESVVCISADTLPVCSGTVVGARTVLTAGHCAWVLGKDVPYFVNVGPDCRAPKKRVRVVDMVTHPSYTGEGQPLDIALVKLAADLGVAALTLSSSEPDAGAPITHVGYGTANEADMSGWGDQRAVTHGLAKLDADFLWSGDGSANTCYGDSGGATLVSGRLAGVISDGPDCHSLSADVRVDSARAFIESTLMMWEPAMSAPPPPQQHGCSSSEGPVLPAALLLMGWLTLGKTRGR
jgi:hypothetical protein